MKIKKLVNLVKEIERLRPIEGEAFIAEKSKNLVERGMKVLGELERLRTFKMTELEFWGGLS